MSSNWFGRRDPDARGYFGAFGGRFVPETLVAPIEALEREYLAAREDAAFGAELDRLLARGAERATVVADATMSRIRDAVGLLPAVPAAFVPGAAE